MNMPYTLIQSSRHSISLQMKTDGTFLVRAPKYLSERKIHEWVETKESWMRKKSELFHQKAIWKEEGIIHYLWEKYTICIDSTYHIDAWNKQVYLPENTDLHTKKYLTTLAREYIPERVRKLAEQYDFKSYTHISITSAKSRWGSCSYKNSLNFSYRLIQYSIEAIDYVIIHELVHTHIKNHSSQFWKAVEQILPDFKEREKLLRK
jgi:predicted metal-dependent hydrolase